MDKVEDLTLLHTWFDRTLPVTNFQEFDNGVVFDLFGYNVQIKMDKCESNNLSNWILGYDIDAVGYSIEIRINELTDIEDVSEEFLIFTETLDRVNKLVSNKTWDYLIFIGLETHRNKIIEAIAQRLTRLQSNIERIATRHPLYLIARF